METATTTPKKAISKKRSFTVNQKGEVTSKGNVTLRITLKSGLMKQNLYMLCDADDVADIEVGSDITEFIPENFKIRESAMESPDGNGEMKTSILKWIESV
jgi:hypothetical protein